MLFIFFNELSKTKYSFFIVWFFFQNFKSKQNKNEEEKLIHLPVGI